MSEQVSVLVLEQRAWRGIRLCSKEPIRKAGDHTFEVSYNYPKRTFQVEVCYQKGETFEDGTSTYGWYGAIEYSNTSLDECISWIERHFNVKVSIEGEKIAQEQNWLQEQEAKKK